ncbi:DUF89 family protein [Candidatus Sumerlaeota bacterium]|nr:DUF89 family protein [Candidatus Sumerlaeota bacterium]
MKTKTLCIPCLMQQAYRTAQAVLNDPNEIAVYLRDVARFIAETDPADSPAVYSSPVYAMLSERTGIADLFAETKRAQNRLALGLLDHVEKAVRSHADPLAAAARVAGAGNLIDCGVGVPQDVERALIAAADRPLAIDDTPLFFERLNGSAKALFYICDNAGEIVFDRLFIQILKERYPMLTVIAAVRGAPVINDALLDDAREVGLDRVADAIVTTGTGMIGAPLDHVGDEFRNVFRSCDLFLCKGHGNFETLNEEARGFFVLTAKCAAVADELGVEVGQSVFVSSETLRERTA